MIVVDLGCADPEGSGWSLARLADAYKPDHIYGFDPSHTLNVAVTEIAGVPVTLRREAAWIFDGEVGYQAAGTSSKIVDGGERVPCFDFPAWLATWVRTLPGDVVVKMDIEGAEYPILNRLVDDGTDQLLAELLIEWHEGPRDETLARLRCPVKEWDG